MVIDENVKGVSFDPDDKYEYTVSAKRKYKEDRRPFNMVAPFRNKNSKRKSMDLLDKLLVVSKAAEQVFRDLVYNMNDSDNLVTMEEWKSIGASKMRSIYRRLVELQETELILKVKHINKETAVPPKFTYMINPYIIKPWEYNKAKETWKLLGGNPL